MAKRGWIGARDQKERDRRQKIVEAFKEARAANNKRAFWKIIRLAGIPDDDPQIPELYRLWCDVFDEDRRYKQ
ncbi:MAG: hypothetical protein HY651_08730 [Acidobacteria bacterium]|nr:hypothetical protein [Acidobacteriota bacterium]